MEEVSLIKHAKGALGLRVFGLGPNLKPTNGLIKLQNYLMPMLSGKKKH